MQSDSLPNPHAMLGFDNSLETPGTIEPPRVHVRWFHAGAPVLLSSAPITLGPQIVWQPLTREESDACEDAWRNLSEEDRQAHNERDVDPDSDDEDMKVGVPVSTDRLFEVDVKALKLYPIYWSTNGHIPVTRGLWMYDETRPVEQSLADQLEIAYIAVKPWQASYLDELSTALEIGPEAQDKLKYPLLPPSPERAADSKSEDLFVIFEDDVIARVYKGGVPRRFAAGLLSSLGLGVGNKSPNVKPSLYGGTVYYRGSDEAAARIKEAQAKKPIEGRSRSGSSSSDRAPPVAERSREWAHLAPNSKRRKTSSVPRGEDSLMTDHSGSGGSGSRVSSISARLTPGSSSAPLSASLPSTSRLSRPLSPTPQPPELGPTSSSEAIVEAGQVDNLHDVTDLILVVHGIGQGLTATYEAFDFVYATNMLREISRKQAQSPAISSIMRGKRVQFLPVQWRASLKLDVGEELEKQRDGLDNHFTLADITLGNTIPFIRDLTNNVLLDIPLFMSHHRERMIASVCTLANRTYRLWCARHPNFETHGRVHVIAHSLGSALVAHILSNQPTLQPPISELPLRSRNSTGQFLFNTSSLFLIGSPLGVFLHLNQRQIIARKGRERTVNSPPDEALDKAGIFGCLAIDTLYNIFNPADPVVYILNPCVDVEKAKDLPATAIPNVTETYISTFSTKVSKMFEGLQPQTSWFSSSPSATNKSTPVPIPGRRQLDDEADGAVEIELSGPGTGPLRGTKAERRFAALNPHGTIDFYLPSEGNISEYVDMITAHSSYWADPNFAAFVLAEIFATATDLMRTSVGLTG